MYQEQVVTEIEKTKRALYGCLDRIRRAGKHRKLTDEFEERLEEHLEVLRQHENNLSRNCLAHLETAGQMRQERDQIQQRLHAVDHAHFEQSRRTGEMARQIERLEDLNRIAGEELIRAQGVARQYLDDCRSAEKHSDEFSEKLRDAHAVIGQQEQLIVGQRLAIAELYMAKKQINIMAAGGRGVGSVHSGAAIVSNGAGYPGSGAGAVNHGVGAGGSGSGGGAGRATGR